jgi:hypothetical protein
MQATPTATAAAIADALAASTAAEAFCFKRKLSPGPVQDSLPQPTRGARWRLLD